MYLVKFRFLWRVCNNVVFVRLLLREKKVVESLICVLCNGGEEFIEHMILECEWTRGVWFACC